MRLKLLLVEDDLDIAYIISEVVCSHFTIVHVSSGDEAMDQLDMETFDVILSDQLLPGQLSGDEVLRRARERHPLGKRFLMTGIHIDEFTARLLRQEEVRLIRKPIRDYDRMVAQLRRCAQ